MRRAIPALLAGLACTALFVVAEGCASFGSTGDPAPAPAADAPFGSDEASVPDAASPDPEAGGTGFCASQAGAAVCEDFDRGGSRPEGWMPDPANGDAGAPTIDGALHRSAPGALRSKTDLAANPDSRSRIQRTVSVLATSAKWTYEAEIFIIKREAPNAQSVSLFGFAMAAEMGVPVSVVLEADGTTTCSGFGKVTAPAIVPQQWYKLVLSAQKRIDAGYDFSCKIGAADPVSGSGGVPMGGAVTNERKLTVGVVNYFPNGPIDVYYDNVVFRSE